MKSVMEVGKFIANRRSMLGLTQVQLAEKIHASARMVSRWETGNNQLKGGFLQLMAEALNVEPEELYSTDSKDEPIKAGIDPLCSFLKSVPVVGSASAGHAIDLPPSQLRESLYDVLGALPPKIMAVRVNGNSMEFLGEHSLCDGDYALVDAGRNDPSQLIGKIVCARLDGEEHLIKQLLSSNGVYYLRSFNPTYPPIRVKTENARIEGEVILVIRKI